MYYENHFYTSKEMMKEYVYKVLSRGIRNVGCIASIFTLPFLVSAIVNRNTVFIYFFTCGIIFILSLVFLTPILLLKRLLDYDKRLHGGKKYECIVTFDSNIRLKEGESSFGIDYEQVIAIYKLRTCSVLMFTRQNGILYTEDGFINNSLDFDKFILEKCPNVSKIITR